MKKYILSVLSVAFLGLTSCTEDIMDDINKDNQHPAPENVSAALQLTDAIMATGFSTVSGDYAFYLSSLNEQEIGIGNNQLMRAELRNSSEWAASTTFNNVWNSTYGNLMNIRQMIEKINTGTQGNAGKYDLLGMAQVLEALNFGVLTDMHGDIPYSEALLGQENLQPKLDAQKDVYAGILKTLEDAISNLEKGKDLKSAGNQDIAFKNDNEQWMATAYALKARYLIHQLAVTEDRNALLAEVKAAAGKAVELGFKGFMIKEFNGVTCDNPWSAYLWSRYYIASSKTVTDLMGSDDPRFTYYTYETGESYTPGDETAAQVADGSLAFPEWYDLGTQPLHLFSVSELYFILAEAKLRLNEDATSEFQKAVTASISEILGWCGDDSDASAYVNSLGTPTLKTLFEQKYIAQCADEQVETYNDLRRLKAMGESYVILTNPYNTQGGINRYPERLPYGNSSVLSNPNVSSAYGDGYYIYSEKTWINGGK